VLNIQDWNNLCFASRIEIDGIPGSLTSVVLLPFVYIGRRLRKRREIVKILKQMKEKTNEASFIILLQTT
jgi:hypothetical protein